MSGNESGLALLFDAEEFSFGRYASESVSGSSPQFASDRIDGFPG